MTKTDTNIPELVINTLTNAEYEAAKQAGEISSTELYMTTDDPDYITADQLENKQDLLISGTNIKTINNQSLLGSGNIVFDTVPTQGSTNAITSGAVYEVLGNLETALNNFNSRTE